MIRKEIPYEEYLKLYESLKGNMRYESPGIDPMFKQMTVVGYSGPGTAFKNEYDRMLHEHFNPPIPMTITIHRPDGVEVISPMRKKP